MAFRRRVITACSGGVWLTAGCLDDITSPDIPRETQILDEQVTIDPGTYQSWPLDERIGSTSFTDDEPPIFSYEFTVEEGPAVTVFATMTEDLDGRTEDSEYRYWMGTLTEGKRGATSERIDLGLLQILVADNGGISSQTATPDRDPATIHAQAYLSRTEQD